jgi:hypothetical protein
VSAQALLRETGRAALAHSIAACPVLACSSWRQHAPFTPWPPPWPSPLYAARAVGAGRQGVAAGRLVEASMTHTAQTSSG